MERRCEEPHCLQMVPEYLFQIHQDYHVAERLAAEEAEQQQTQHFGANADAAAEAVTIAQNGDTEDSDYQFALALNREYREEEEQHFFRQMQKREVGVESQEEEEHRTKSLKIDDTRSPTSSQMVLGPNLRPLPSSLLSNETPGLIYGLQKALENDPASSHSVLCSAFTSHIETGFTSTGWGCGYVNAQMLLSHLRQANPEPYTKAFGSEIPSVRKIQDLIEAGWEKGIDNVGAEQLRRSLRGTRKWIGTTEIYTLLTSAGFRCLVHDFDLKNPLHVQSLVKYVEDYFKCPSTLPPTSDSDTPSSNCKISDLPPLYFQHAGHSRTIVGMERLKSGQINFLLFNPSKKPSSLAKDFAIGKTTKLKLSEAVLKPYRVSVTELSKRKEYQILRLQEGLVDEEEREVRKKVNFIKMN